MSKSLRKWLQDANLSSQSIELLILHGYNEIRVFMCCTEDDIETIANKYNIPRLDKLKLKLAIDRHKNKNNCEISNVSTNSLVQHQQMLSNNRNNASDQNTYVNYQQKYDSLQSKYDQLENEYKQQVQENDVLQNNIRIINETLKIKEENEKLQAKLIIELEQENEIDQQDLLQEKTNSQQKIQKLSDDYNELNEKHNELKQKNKILTETYNQLNEQQQRHKLLTDNYNKLNEKHHKLNQENNTLTTKYNQLNQKYDKLNAETINRNSNEIAQVNTLKQTISQLTLQLENAKQNINKNQLNNSVLQSKIDQLSQQINPKYKQIAHPRESPNNTSIMTKSINKHIFKMHRIPTTVPVPHSVHKSQIATNRKRSNNSCKNLFRMHGNVNNIASVKQECKTQAKVEQKNIHCIKIHGKKRPLDQYTDNEPQIKKKLKFNHDENSTGCISSKTHKTVSEQMNKMGNCFAFQYHICVHCHVCKQHFVEYNQYMSHVRKHYTDDPNKNWLQCDLGCKNENLFSNSHVFVGHIARHTNDKPFKCDFPKCTSSFGYKERLKEHWTRHLLTQKNEISNFLNENVSVSHSVYKPQMTLMTTNRKSLNNNSQTSLGRVSKINVNKNKNTHMQTSDESDDEPIIKKFKNNNSHSTLRIPKKSISAANSQKLNKKYKVNHHKHISKTKIIGLPSKIRRKLSKQNHNNNKTNKKQQMHSHSRNVNNHKYRHG